MEIAGIIAEYNPFHNGHAYQIDAVKKLYGATHVCALMSSSVTQRGEPSIFNIRKRTELALKGGVDLVLCLPYPYCAQTAEVFAGGGIRIIDKMKLDYVSFGCESADFILLRQAAQILLDEPAPYKNKLKEDLKKGLSFAVSRQNALQATTNRDMSFLSLPNNILAVEYIKALLALSSAVVPIPVLRYKSPHDCDEIDSEVTSASNIRAHIMSKKISEIFGCLPKEVYGSAESISGIKTNHIENYKTIFKSFLLMLGEPHIRNAPDYEAGLEKRMMSHIDMLDLGVERYIEAVSSKRYAKSRIRRMLFNIALGYTKQHQQLLKDCTPQYVRVLGFNSGGREMINEIKKRSDIKIVANVSKEYGGFNENDRLLVEFDSKAYELYHIFEGKKMSDTKLSPLILP